MSLDIFGAITGLFAIVYDGQHGLRFTMGRAKAVVAPGIHFKWPIFQTFKIEETKHTTLDLQPQVIQLMDDLVYEVDCKVVYQIVNLRKAIIEIDDLVTGLQNRVVIAIQHIVSHQDRHSVKNVDEMCNSIRAELRPIEEQWGVQILQFGFSNISPSPTTLEITQLELLAKEKLAMYRVLRDAGLSDEATVALISGAIVSVQTDTPLETIRAQRQQEETAVQVIAEEILTVENAPDRTEEEADPAADEDDSEEEDV
jgi:regulator of protease activity HflC (stomatin/prohibitin superfamily)